MARHKSPRSRNRATTPTTPPPADGRGVHPEHAASAGPLRTRAPRRRAVWLAIILGALGLGAAATWYFRQTPAVAFRRTADQNVLLVTLDTMRADAMSGTGGRAATPTLDRLAALGVRFDFAHAHAVLTLPSHASILSGLYPFQHGVHDNAGFRFPDHLPTLATMLRAKNVETGAFIGAFALDSRFGLARGFDLYDERYGRSEIGSGFTMAERRADAVVGAAAAWIAARRGRWFAWVHLFDPHAPYAPPPPYDRQYADQPYYGEVAYTDAMLAPLFDAARDPSGRPTLVVVTGDHGEGLGDHGEMTHGLFAYEATLRIPLILAQIGRDTPAWADGRPVSGTTTGTRADARHIDLLPTVLDALGLEMPAGLPGRTLLPDAPGAGGDRASYFEAVSATFNRGWAPLTGVLAGGRKYIDLPLPELYDLPRDPAETSNLVDRDLDSRRLLEARLRGFNASPVASARLDDGESRRRLHALGYVTGDAPRKARYAETDDPKRLVALDRRLRDAMELYERGRRPDAIPIYREIIAARPSMEIAYAQLAMLQWELGATSEAIATLRSSIEAGCASLAVRTRLGNYLAETGRVAEAIPLLEEAVATDGRDVDALNALGIALARSGRTVDARRAFERLLVVNPANTMALENLGSIALAEGRLEEARRFYGRALEADPGSTQAHNGLGVIEQRSGNRTAALSHFEAAVARDAHNFDALFNLTTALVDAGRLDAARPYLERFVRTAPAALYGRDIARLRGVLDRMSRSPR